MSERAERTCAEQTKRGKVRAQIMKGELSVFATRHSPWIQTERLPTEVGARQRVGPGWGPGARRHWRREGPR